MSTFSDKLKKKPESTSLLASLSNSFKGVEFEEKESKPIEIEEPEKEETDIEGDKFIVISSYGEILDVALQLKQEKYPVKLLITENEYKKIGEGMIDKVDDYFDFLGKGWIFVVDGCEHAKLQDWLREQGEWVVGTNQIMSEYEDNRQKGQDWFTQAGFNQPENHNFTDIDEALEFVKENDDKRWVLKQNGSAPKHLNHVGKFEGGIDMIFHLEEVKKGWSESEYLKFNCDLMEVVEGVELAVSGFFNGNDWLRDKDGKVIGFLNFEEKKECDGGLGETTGEMGTTFFGVDETNPIFADILLRPEITQVLRDTGYQGVFDINGTLTDDGFTAFEATSRFGVPTTSYEFLEGLKGKTGELIKAMACGEDTPIEIEKGWGMVMVVAGKPFPIEADIDNNATTMGEKIWILNGGSPSKMTNEQKKHIHFENVYQTDGGDFKVATKSGYILTVTGRGEDLEETRENLIDYIKNNIYISGMKYRHDIGKRIEDFI